MSNKYKLLTDIAALRDESERLKLSLVTHFLDLAVEELGDALEVKDDNAAPVAISSEMLQKYFGQEFPQLIAQ